MNGHQGILPDWLHSNLYEVFVSRPHTQLTLDSHVSDEPPCARHMCRVHIMCFSRPLLSSVSHAGAGAGWRLCVMLWLSPVFLISLARSQEQTYNSNPIDVCFKNENSKKLKELLNDNQHLLMLRGPKLIWPLVTNDVKTVVFYLQL